MTFQIHLTGNQLSSNSQKAITLTNSKKLGEKKQDKIIYSKYESLYLIEKEKTQLIYKDKPVSESKAKKLLSKEKDFSVNYAVFKDLRKKGYVVKTGLKFGTEFRVYNKNKKHAIWLVYPTTQKTKIQFKEFIAINRIANTTGKKILIAIVDSQEDITYYEVSWIKP